MDRNAKHCLIFLAALAFCGGGIAALYLFVLNPHQHHQAPAKRSTLEMYPDFHPGELPGVGAAIQYLDTKKDDLTQAITSYTHGISYRHQKKHHLLKAEKRNGDQGSYFITIPTSTPTSLGAQPVATTTVIVYTSLSTYSSFPMAMGALTTSTAAVGYQASVIQSSNSISSALSILYISSISAPVSSSAQSLTASYDDSNTPIDTITVVPIPATTSMSEQPMVTPAGGRCRHVRKFRG